MSEVDIKQWGIGEHTELRTNDHAFLGANSLYSPANASQETWGSETHWDPVKSIDSEYILY